MSTVDYIVIGVVICLAVLAVIYIVRQKKKGRCIGCSQNCAGCKKNKKSLSSK